MPTDFRKIIEEAKARRAAADAELKAAIEQAQTQAGPLVQQLEEAEKQFIAAKEKRDALREQYKLLFGAGGLKGARPVGAAREKIATVRLPFVITKQADGIHVAGKVVHPDGTTEDKGEVVVAIEDGVSPSAMARTAMAELGVLDIASEGQKSGLATRISLKLKG